MPRVPDNWPPGALPRVMDRELASYYCNVSPNTFDRLVAAGKLPLPRPVDGTSRKGWDLRQLDRAIDHWFPEGNLDEATATRQVLQERMERCQAKPSAPQR